MGLSLLCGFEMGDLSEAKNKTGTPTLSTSVVKDGTYSLRCNATNAVTSVSWNIIGAGAVLANFAQSGRFWFRVDAIGSAAIFIWQTGSFGTDATRVAYNLDGTMQIRDGGSGGIVNSTSTVSTGQWHLGWVNASGTTRDLYVDGVLLCHSTGGGTAGPKNQPGVGILNGVSIGTWDVYFDNVAWHDGSIGVPDNLQHKFALLIPTAGNNANSWTGGAGGTGDIHGAVDNIPPVGLAAASETNSSQIKNAASGGNLDYTATMQSYAAAGVPQGSVIHAVMALVNDGEEVTTNTKSGSVWIASNPAQTAAGTTFDYGDDSATAIGTFPTGWTTHVGPVTETPSITLGTAPTVTVRKTTSTTRVVGVDFMGLYVDFTPPSQPTVLIINQSVRRASYY